MDLHELEFGASSAPETIAKAVRSSGIAVVPEFIRPELLDVVVPHYEALRCIQEGDCVQRTTTPYQEVTILTPSRLSKRAHLSATQYHADFAVLEPFESLNGLVNSGFVRGTASSYYEDEDYIHGNRIQVIDTYDSPSTLVDAPYYLHHDRVRFLKFFIYLNDVTLENGPMEFVLDPDLNRRAEINRQKQILARTPWLMMDNKVEVAEDRVIAITAKAGTLVVFDSNVPHRQGALNPGTNRKVFLVESQLLQDAHYHGVLNLDELVGTKLPSTV
ncbi:MAG: hypothetical protein ACI9BW_002762 [Gammaproteobacteria bacterium]|jgi:hypothetical protein